MNNSSGSLWDHIVYVLNFIRPHRSDKAWVLTLKIVLLIACFPLWVYIIGGVALYSIFTKIKHKGISVSLGLIVIFLGLFIGTAWAFGCTEAILSGGHDNSSSSADKNSAPPIPTKLLAKATSTNTPTPKPTKTITATPTSTPTPTEKPTQTNTPTPTSKPTQTSTPTPTPTETSAQKEADYKASTADTTVDNLDKDGNLDSGTNVHFLSKIISFVKDDNGDTSAVNVSANTEFSTTFVQVSLPFGSDVTQLNKNDVLEVWGSDEGVYSGTNAFGGNVQEVVIQAKYIDNQTTNYHFGY